MINDSKYFLDALKREREFKKANEQAYRDALKREKDREYCWRHTKQGAFESSFASLDDLMEKSTQPDKMSVFSDRGKGAKRIYAALDYERNIYLKRLNAARKRLENEHPELLEVFDLIVKNGTDRKESIWQMTSKRLKNGTLQKSNIGGT